MSGRVDYGRISSLLNRLYRVTGAECYFEEPFFGVAAAADPWFERFKQVIGGFHWTPQEALEQVAPGTVAGSVIVWILPVKSSTRAANAEESVRPAVPWAAMRSFGELANDNMRRQFCRLLEEAGFRSAAPQAPHSQCRSCPPR